MEVKGDCSWIYDEDNLVGLECSVSTDEEGSLVLDNQLMADLVYAWLEKKGPAIIREIIQDYDLAKGIKPPLKRENAFRNV